MKINNEIQSLININLDNLDSKNQEIKMNNISKKIKLKRNSSFELLRIILMYLIILSHIKYHGKSIPSMNSKNYKQIINKKYILLRIISNYGKFSNILFIMISGYFSIKRKIFHFYKFLLNINIIRDIYISFFFFIYFK